MALGFAMLAAVGVFIVAELIQTFAAMRAFFSRQWIRIHDYVKEQ